MLLGSRYFFNGPKSLMQSFLLSFVMTLVHLPPATGKTAPVTYSALSDNSHKIALATS